MNQQTANILGRFVRALLAIGLILMVGIVIVSCIAQNADDLGPMARNSLNLLDADRWMGQQPTIEVEPEPVAELAKTGTDQPQKLIEVGCDDQPNAFHESWEDSIATMTLGEEEFATSSSDPVNIFVDGKQVYSTAMGALILFNNYDDETHTVGYATSWNTANLHRNVHACRWQGNRVQALAKTAEWQEVEDKPVYVEIQIDNNGNVTFIDLNQVATAPTVAAPTVAAPTVAAPTVAAPTVAAPTVAAPQDEPCGHRVEGVGTIYASSDPGTLIINGTTFNATTRFTVYSLDTDANVQINGVPAEHIWFCSDSDGYAEKFDNAPTRYNISEGGQVTIVNVNP